MEGRECFGPEMAKEGGWDAVIGVVGNARKGEMGSGLTLLPASRTLKSRCLPQ